MKKGFTLVELLVVVALVAVLAVVVVLTLNPPELLRQARDAARVSDIGTLNKAISLYYQNAMDNPNTLFMGTSSVIYISIPDPAATSTVGDQCQGLGLPAAPTGYAYQCAASSTYTKTNGTGWIPINFSSYVAGSVIAKLPKDPTNTTSTNLYYTYTTDGIQYELTSMMEASKDRLGGSSDLVSTDGGSSPYEYEKGTSLTLTPSAEQLVNPIFSTGDMTGWVNDSGGVNGLVSSPTHWSKYSLITQGSNSYCNNYYLQDLPVQQNTTYSIGGWLKTVNEVGTAYMGIANTSWGNWVNTTGITGTTNWTYQSISTNSGSNTALRFWVSVGWCGGPSPGNGPSGTSYFTDISVVKGSLLLNGPN